MKEYCVFYTMAYMKIATRYSGRHDTDMCKRWIKVRAISAMEAIDLAEVVLDAEMNRDMERRLQSASWNFRNLTGRNHYLYSPGELCNRLVPEKKGYIITKCVPWGHKVVVDGIEYKANHPTISVEEAMEHGPYLFD